VGVGVDREDAADADGAPGALDRPKIRAFRTWLRQEADA
jgi:hypothetical protein